MPTCTDLDVALLEREMTEADLIARLQVVKNKIEEIQGPPGMPNVLRAAMQVILDTLANEVSGLGLPPLS